MMSHFVGDYIGLGEISLGSEAGMHFVKKTHIQIDFFVQRTIERPHGRLGKSAGGFDRLGEKNQFRGLVSGARTA